MRARVLFASLGFCLTAAPPVGGVTVDDFAVGYPGASGGVFTDGTGVGFLSQPGIAVLGGTRDTRVTVVDPGMPGGVTIIPNPSPPPVKNVLEGVIGGSGGDTRLGYPALAGYDLTQGPGGTFPASVEVLVALMVAGGTLELTLADSTGGVATASLPTADFFGASPSGLAKYAFFPTAGSFAGVNLTSIDELAVRVALPTGADFELSDIQIVPVAAASVDWDRAFAFEPVGGGSADPRILVGFDMVPPDPLGPPVLDLSDPARPRISWVGGIDPESFFEFAIAAYGGVGINPCVAPGELEIELNDTVTYRMVLEVTSSDGQVLDPGTLFGFNPQPEPPVSSLFDWADPPLVNDRVAFGLSLGLQAPPMPPPPTGPGDGVTLAFQILGPGDVPVPLQQVQLQGPAVPALPLWAALALGALLAAVVAQRARNAARAG